ncbi:MAG: hypothetical protein JWO92_1476 [Chitinophagaceae bacterium]|nr:hypothetical protein [Chitinophagaceae bacterium]MDB5222640.1 hypothetical protein [Chitinophagaceae bacterium]
MNHLIVNFVFGFLSIIFLFFVTIVIKNAIKIARFNKLSIKLLKEENQVKLSYLKTEIKDKLIPLIPTLPVFKSISLNEKPLPLLIQ